MNERRRKKRRKRARSEDWAEKGEFAFTHDLKRHRRTTGAITEKAKAMPEEFEPNALVVSHSKKWAFVKRGDEELLCRISESLVESGATILAPGDEVLVQEVEEQPFVLAVAERRSKLSRLAIEHSRVAEQVIAANIDILVVVVSAAKPRFKPGLVDRYLICAEVGNVRPVLCLNKIDLVNEEPPELAPYHELDLTIVKSSCETGEGIGELRQALEGRISVFAGQSGVGKSSLLNALAPNLDIETQEVSHATEKGKHTTSSSRLYEVGGNIRVIDTPGIRKLGLWGVSHEELTFYFPELEERAQHCKFRDCTHTHEPDCAVLEAVESGEIPRQRYDSYLRIRASVEEQTRKY